MRRYIKTRRERARKKYLVITNKVLRLCKVCYYRYYTVHSVSPSANLLTRCSKKY